MEIVFFSKNEQASLFLKKSIKKVGHNCSCANSLSSMIRLLREKAPDIVFSDTRDINLYGFDVDNHLEVMGAKFLYYDLYRDANTQKVLPKSEIFLSIVEKYYLFVEIQHYKNTKSSEKSLILRKNKLQNHHILLLQHFFQHPNEKIESKRLIEIFWNKTKGITLEIGECEEHQNTLYSYISQIKKFISNVSFDLDIFRSGKGFYTCCIED